MSWVNISMCSTMVGMFMLFVVYMYLYIMERKAFLGILAVSWGVMSLKFVLNLLEIGGGSGAFLEIAEQMTLVLSNFFFFWGMHHFVGIRMKKWWILIFALNVFYSIIGIYNGFPFRLYTFPTILLMGTIYIWSGILMNRYKHMSGKVKAVVVAAFILWGIHVLDYPLLRPLGWIGPWGFLLSSLLATSIALGILYFHFEGIRQALNSSEERYRMMAEKVSDIIYRIRVTPDFGFEYVSPAAAQITGYSPEEYYADPKLGRRVIHPEDHKLLKELAPSLDQVNSPLVFRLFHKNGKMVWLDMRNTRVYDHEGNVMEIYGVARDITEYKQVQQRMRRTNRLYWVLSKINQTILHIHDLSELYKEACRIAVEEGSLRMAWIGFVDDKGQQVSPAAWWGKNDGYLEKHPVFLDDGSYESQLIGKVIRERSHIICDDIEEKLPMGIRREGALERGYRSVGIFSLSAGGESIGVICFYAAETEFFDEKVEMLLESLADDVSFAIESIRREKQRQAAEEALKGSRERYRILFNMIPDGVFVHKDGTLIFANGAAAKMVGAQSPEMLTCRPMMDFIEPAQREKEQLRIDHMLQTGEKDCLHEQKLLKLNGKLMDIEITSAISHFEGGPVILALARDITKKKQAEGLKNKLRTQNRILEEALEYDKLKTEFFANISHELRTPLNVILGTIQLLNLYESNPGESREGKSENKYIRIMRQNCYRLLRLVNNLIDITKMDAGFFEINLSNHNIVGVVEEITLSVADYVENKGVQLVFDTDVEERVIACDPDRMERVILNLLSNAIKFTPSGGSITVTLQDKGDWVQITVQDTGSGIPKEKINDIFERFRQVDKSLARTHEGSGIGLSLVKSLVEKHGGRVKAESELGKGTRFVMELPVTLVEQEAERSPYYGYLKEGHVEKISVELSDIYSSI